MICGNTSAQRVHEISDARAQRAHEAAEGAAFRELTTDTATFLEAAEDLMLFLEDGHLTEQQIRDEDSRRVYRSPADTEARIKRAARARDAIKALQAIVVNHTYSRAQSDHERAIALFLADVTAYWMDGQIARRLEKAA